MEKNENQLQEQEAPIKNNDNAFVQVGKNGEPVIPGQAEKNEQETKADEKHVGMRNS